MEIKYKSEKGVIHQIEREFENIGAVAIDISYSVCDPTLEFDCVSLSLKDNDHLSLKQKREINKALESGLEEAIVLFLINKYRKTEINFIHPACRVIPYETSDTQAISDKDLNLSTDLPSALKTLNTQKSKI